MYVSATQTRILEITYCTPISALDEFPCTPAPASLFLFSSVIWNVITHHFRVLQEPDTYISLSAFLPSTSLLPAAFVRCRRTGYFPPPYIFFFFSTTPTITYVNEPENQLSATKCAPSRRLRTKRSCVHDWTRRRYVGCGEVLTCSEQTEQETALASATVKTKLPNCKLIKSHFMWGHGLNTEW